MTGSYCSSGLRALLPCSSGQEQRLKHLLMHDRGSDDQVMPSSSTGQPAYLKAGRTASSRGSSASEALQGAAGSWVAAAETLMQAGGLGLQLPAWLEGEARALRLKLSEGWAAWENVMQGWRRRGTQRPATRISALPVPRVWDHKTHGCPMPVWLRASHLSGPWRPGLLSGSVSGMTSIAQGQALLAMASQYDSQQLLGIAVTHLAGSRSQLIKLAAGGPQHQPGTMLHCTAGCCTQCSGCMAGMVWQLHWVSPDRRRVLA